jgi:hypothetical protein
MSEQKEPTPNEERLAGLLNELTEKQRAFVMAWFNCRNGTEAAKMAGYNGKRQSLATVASDNMRKPKIRRIISLMWEVHGASAEEAIDTLTRQMRAQTSDFIDEHGRLLIEKVRAAGPGIIQEYDEDRKRIRLYSAQRAAEVVLKTYRQDEGKGGGPGELSGKVTIEFVQSEEHKKLKPGS